MSKALYRKYRSKRLSDVVGQGHVTDILARSLAAGRVAHAYLLTGPRGVGKTSIARILAHEINQLPYDEETNHLDIIEIDAASNNGVEDVRDLRDKVQIAPVSAAKKVYIIDEVHMLSKAAFNALLKTLEEPPEHAVFILATTDVDKLPATIISRTQRFSFRAINVDDATKHLAHIAKEEGITVENDALELIARRGDGSFRDSISLLDQLRGLTDGKTPITRQLVEDSLGLASLELVDKLLHAYETRDLKNIVALLDESEASGVQTTVLATQLIDAVRRSVTAKPQLIPLLDQLLDVAKSSQPSIKLLAILAAHAAPKPKTAALAAPVAEVSAPIEELEKAAVSSSPSHSLHLSDRSTTQSSDTTATKLSETSAARASAAAYATEARSEAVSENFGGGSGSEKSNTPKSDGTATNLDWEALIEYARTNYVAVYSVLSKCGYEQDGDKLVLYTSNAFYKKKLDDSKHRINLMNALLETGAGDLVVETIGTPPPPKDSTAAAVAAIMGGGEEVKVDEVSA